jgi:hypothetical protein
MNLTEILQGANVALHVISTRLLTLLAMLGTFALFAWAMWLQTILGAIIASAWGLTIFLPVLFADRGGSSHAETPQHPAEP